MAKTQNGSAQAREKSEKTNAVLGVTEVRVFAFRYADTNGNVNVAMALNFGKDNEDGGPGVYVINPEDIQAVLKTCPNFVKSAIRGHLNQKPADLTQANTELPTFGSGEA